MSIDMQMVHNKEYMIEKPYTCIQCSRRTIRVDRICQECINADSKEYHDDLDLDRIVYLERRERNEWDAFNRKYSWEESF